MNVAHEWQGAQGLDDLGGRWRGGGRGRSRRRRRRGRGGRTSAASAPLVSVVINHAQHPEVGREGRGGVVPRHPAPGARRRGRGRGRGRRASTPEQGREERRELEAAASTSSSSSSPTSPSPLPNHLYRLGHRRLEGQLVLPRRGVLVETDDELARDVAPGGVRRRRREELFLFFSF